MKRKKIGIFSGYFLPHLGGVERYSEKLSAELLKLGYKVVIITSNYSELPDEEVVAGVRIYRLPTYSFAKDRYPIPKTNTKYQKLIQKIEQESIDYYLLNTRFHLTSLVGARMGKRLGKPTILIEHGTGHFTVNNKIIDVFGGIYEHILTMIVKRHVDAFYGVSKNCNNWLRHFGIKARGVFYNAVNPEDAEAVENIYDNIYEKDYVVITYAGRLIKEKGILNLLDAFMDVKDKYPKLRLVIAGDGGLLDHIKQKYKDPRVDLLGRLDFDNVMALYKRTDIFVYPSLYPEGLPTSILEAGLMNCAVIATPRGGTEEVIVDEGHGIIVSGDIDSIRESIEKLATSSTLRNSMAQKLKHRVENVFNWKAVANTVSNEIRSLRARDDL